jgi:hypothetical protein
MPTQQIGLDTTWGLLFDILISVAIWGTVIAGLILVVRDTTEEDTFRRQHPLNPDRAFDPKEMEVLLSGNPCSECEHFALSERQAGTETFVSSKGGN